MEFTLDQKKDIELIMRQTECYNTALLKQKYLENNGNVLETICDVLEVVKKEEAIKQDKFTEFRAVLEEKDRLFNVAMKR